MYILTSKYFPLDYWPDLYFPALPDVAVDIQYTEVMEFAVCIATSADFSVVLPNEVDAVTGTMVVSGAGTSAANGTWTYAGELYGKPYYALGENMLFWYGAGGYWVLASSYYSTDDVATPDLVTTWTVSAGSLPLPTVTSATVPILTEVAAFTVEMPMIIDFELYEELSA